MPINCYTGLMGSGKSYEIVRSVILPAILAGRRVVTNIDGLSQDKIHAHLTATDRPAPPAGYGVVVHVTNDDICSARFLYHGPDAPDTLVQPGDLVVVDEAWRAWGKDAKILHEHMVFFREHRHYVHPETKISCDMAIAVQHIMDVHLKLRNVLELTFRTTKLKSVGINRGYRVEMYEGGRVARYGRVAVNVHRYDKRIFPLYSSYSGGTGLEKQIDRRQNILAAPKLKWIGLGLVVMLAVAGTTVTTFFTSFGESDADPGTADADADADPDAPASAASPATPPPVQTAAPAIEPDTPWRVVGSIRSDRLIIILSDGRRTRRLYDPPDYFLNGRTINVALPEGGIATDYAQAKAH